MTADSLKKLEIFMSFKIFLTSSLFLLFAQFCAYGLQTDFSYTIKGRVVDEYSKPVAKASVRVRSPKDDGKCTIIRAALTDPNGFFVIRSDFSKSYPEWTLLVIDESRVLEDTNSLYDLGLVFDSQCSSSFATQKTVILKDQENELGDIRVQYTEYPVLIQLLDPNGKPLIKERNEYGFNPWWIVRDPRGDIISEGGNAYIHYRFSESAVMNSLPEGSWHLEVSDDNGSGFETSQIIDIAPVKEVQKITLKLKKATDLKFEGRRKTFPYTPKEARQKIEEMGFDFTQGSYEERVLHGNHEVVALFLNAGMNPNVLTKSEWLLDYAVRHPQVLKLLIEAGADVNRKSDDGYTALMTATMYNLNTIKMLLDAGADVGIKDNEGHDALYYSQINDDNPEITKLLKKYAAKKKLK